MSLKYIVIPPIDNPGLGSAGALPGISRRDAVGLTRADWNVPTVESTVTPDRAPHQCDGRLLSAAKSKHPTRAPPLLTCAEWITRHVIRNDHLTLVSQKGREIKQ